MHQYITIYLDVFNLNIFSNKQNNFSWNNLPESFPVLSMPVSSYLEYAL